MCCIFFKKGGNGFNHFVLRFLTLSSSTVCCIGKVVIFSGRMRLERNWVGDIYFDKIRQWKFREFSCTPG